MGGIYDEYDESRIKTVSHPGFLFYGIPFFQKYPQPLHKRRVSMARTAASCSRKETLKTEDVLLGSYRSIGLTMVLCPLSIYDS